MTREKREEAANWLEHYCYGKPNILRDCDDDIAEKIQTALDEAIVALREQGWVRTSERLPTVLDTDDEGKVPVLIRGMLTGSWIRITIFYKAVTTDTAEYFLPLPRAPEEEE